MKELKEFTTNLQESSFKKYESLQRLCEKTLNEGYEKVVLELLEDEGIQANFSFGTLYVDEEDLEKAKKVLKNNMAKERDIHSMPKIAVNK